MAAIAIIGPDGAGKTTITRMLLASSSLPFKYVYMGINIDASNFALPTTRLAAYLKKRWGNGLPASTTAHPPTSTRRDRKRQLISNLRAIARLVNRLADEWYRQMVSWSYQWRGYIVLYDRHFVFDFALDTAEGRNQPFDKRLHSWCLSHLYPRPDLTVYLDAPAEVLYARKGEWTIDNLESKRQTMLRQGSTLPNFIQVDAMQPLDVVYDEVLGHIMRFRTSRTQASHLTTEPKKGLLT
jgi:thymidylate kinase